MRGSRQRRMVGCAEVTDRGERSRLGDGSLEREREEEVRRSVARHTERDRELRDLEKESLRGAVRSGEKEREEREMGQSAVNAERERDGSRK
jgi:hypothetical protein